MRLNFHCPLALALVLPCVCVHAEPPAVPPAPVYAPLHWVPLPPLPNVEGFAGGLAGVSDGALLFAGGANFAARRHWQGGTKLYYDTVYLLPTRASYWRPVGRLPHPLGYGVAASYENSLIIAGGTDGSRTYADVIAATWRRGRLEFRNLPPLPAPCAFSAGAIVGHLLYVTCGIEGGQFTAVQAMGELWALDLEAPSQGWRSLPALPGPGREDAAAGAFGGNLYVFGGVALRAGDAGRQVETVLRDAYVYRPGAGWSRLPDMPDPRAGSPSPVPVTPDGRLWVLTGAERLPKVEGPADPGFPQNGMAYDPAANRWTLLPDMPIGRSTPGVASWDGLWVMIGGERRAGYRSPEVWALSLADFHPLP